MKTFAKTCALASLLGGFVPAQAQSTVLAFTFSPVACSWANCGTNAVTGFFSFNDLNGDGHASLAELVQLSVQASGVPGAITAPGPGPLGGQQTVTAFSYTQGGALSFIASDGWRTTVNTARPASAPTPSAFRYDAPGGSLVVSWLPSTTVTVSPIPEPAQAWLWLAGGGVLASWVRLVGRKAAQGELGTSGQAAARR